MEVTAEMILDIAKLTTAAAAVERRLAQLGVAGEAAAARMNRAFATSDISRSAGTMGRRMGLDAFRNAPRQMTLLQGAMAGISASAGATLSVLLQIFTALWRIARTATIVSTALAGWQIGKSVVAAGQSEQMLLQMQTFARSAEKGKSIMQQVAKFSATTPFQVENLEQGTLLLMQAGVAAEDVVELMKEIARVSGDDEQFLGLVDAYSKGFTKQKFDLEQINRFLERGVNLLPYLAASRAQSVEELMKSISAGDVTPADMEDALASMSERGGQFFGLLERRSRTLPGLWSTMLDGLTQVRRALGAPMLEPLKDVIRSVIGQMDALKAKAAVWGDFLGRMTDLISAGLQVKGIGDFWGVWLASGAAAMKWVINMASRFSLAWRAAIGGIAEAFGTGIREGLSLHLETMEAMITAWATGIAERIRETIERAWSKLYSAGAGMMPWQSSRYQQMSAEATARADAHGAAAAESFRQSREAADSGRRGGALVSETIYAHALTNMRRAWDLANQLFDQTGEMLDNGGEKQRIADYFREIFRIVRERRGGRGDAMAFDPNQDSGAGVLPLDDGNGAAAGAAAAGRSVWNGELSRQFNWLAGRSPSELILQETREQTGYLSGIRSTLERIEKKLGWNDEFIESVGGQFVRP